MSAAESVALAITFVVLFVMVFLPQRSFKMFSNVSIFAT
jgi:hypothetical protein